MLSSPLLSRSPSYPSAQTLHPCGTGTCSATTAQCGAIVTGRLGLGGLFCAATEEKKKKHRGDREEPAFLIAEAQTAILMSLPEPLVLGLADGLIGT